MLSSFRNRNRASMMKGWGVVVISLLSMAMLVSSTASAAPVAVPISNTLEATVEVTEPAPPPSGGGGGGGGVGRSIIVEPVPPGALDGFELACGDIPTEQPWLQLNQGIFTLRLPRGLKYPEGTSEVCLGIRPVDDAEVTPFDRHVFLQPQFEAKVVARLNDGSELELQLIPGSRLDIDMQGLSLAGAHPGTVALFRYDPGEETWQYVPSQYVASRGRLTALLMRPGIMGAFAGQPGFGDIHAHWAQRDIEALASRQVVLGMTDSIYQPEGSLTRAQAVTMLVRLLGIASMRSSQDPAFEDVSPDDWFAPYVVTAYDAGLVRGMSVTQFTPELPITREQFTALLMRAAGYVGPVGSLGATDAKAIFNSFRDGGEVSPWARTELARAVQLGFIRGRTVSQLEPGGLVTRAEAATMLNRFLAWWLD